MSAQRGTAIVVRARSRAEGNGVGVGGTPGRVVDASEPFPAADGSGCSRSRGRDGRRCGGLDGEGDRLAALHDELLLGGVEDLEGDGRDDERSGVGGDDDEVPLGARPPFRRASGGERAGGGRVDLDSGYRQVRHVRRGPEVSASREADLERHRLAGGNALAVDASP